MRELSHKQAHMCIFPAVTEVWKEECEEKTADGNNFIRQYQRNGNMDFSELRDIDSLHNKGTGMFLPGVGAHDHY